MAILVSKPRCQVLPSTLCKPWNVTRNKKWGRESGIFYEVRNITGVSGA